MAATQICGILLLLVAVVSPTAKINCNDGNYYIRADPESCSHFYKCDNGRPVRFTCPSGLLYNPSTYVCDWPYNVKCENNVGENYNGNNGQYNGNNGGQTYNGNNNQGQKSGNYVAHNGNNGGQKYNGNGGQGQNTGNNGQYNGNGQGQYTGNNGQGQYNGNDGGQKYNGNNGQGQNTGNNGQYNGNNGQGQYNENSGQGQYNGNNGQGQYNENSGQGQYNGNDGGQKYNGNNGQGHNTGNNGQYNQDNGKDQYNGGNQDQDDSIFYPVQKPPTNPQDTSVGPSVQDPPGPLVRPRPTYDQLFSGNQHPYQPYLNQSTDNDI